MNPMYINCPEEVEQIMIKSLKKNFLNKILCFKFSPMEQK